MASNMWAATLSVLEDFVVHAGARQVLCCASCVDNKFSITFGFEFLYLDGLAEGFDRDWNGLFNFYMAMSLTGVRVYFRAYGVL